jgi:hypothetical protein
MMQLLRLLLDGSSFIRSLLMTLHSLSFFTQQQFIPTPPSTTILQHFHSWLVFRNAQSNSKETTQTTKSCKTTKTTKKSTLNQSC